jgi:hypothetical protein
MNSFRLDKIRAVLLKATIGSRQSIPFRLSMKSGSHNRLLINQNVYRTNWLIFLDFRLKKTSIPVTRFSTVGIRITKYLILIYRQLLVLVFWWLSISQQHVGSQDHIGHLVSIESFRYCLLEKCFKDNFHVQNI